MLQKRIEMHSKAQKLMYACDYQSASDLLMEAIQDHGPHVGLLADLASSAYLACQIDLFVRATKELQTEFQSHGSQLSDDSYMRTCLALGKLLEEIGEVAPALALYENALLDRPFFRLTHLAFTQKVEVQILRLKADLGIRSDLSGLYQSCIRQSQNNQDLEIELEHGLMLAEIQLLGLETAKARFQVVSEKVQSLTDARLIYFDLLEEVLRRNQKLPEISFPLSEMDHFEKVLYFMARSSEFSMSFRELHAIQKKVSPLCYLRICILNLSRTSNPEIRKQILFLLEALSSESRQMLMKKWAKELERANTSQILTLSSSSIQFEGQSLSLNPENFEYKCLELLSANRSIDLEAFIQKTFQIKADEFSSERARVAILRLNKKLAQLTGLPKIILFSKKEISLPAEVEIQKI